MVEIGDDTQAWAQAQWGQACLGDARRTRRAVQVGAAMAAKAGESLPHQMGDWPALKGAYRLLARPEVAHGALTEPHRAATRAAAEQVDGPALFLQDTTQLDYTHHPNTTGLGPVGRGRKQRGFLVHTTLAVRPDARCASLLGMADQIVWPREGTGKRHQPRAERLARDKESDVWSDALAAIGAPPAGACWVSVSDRESDIFEYLTQARALGWHCVVRARHDRVLEDGGLPLLGRLRAQPSQGQRTVRLSVRAGGRPERAHTLQVSWMAAHLPSPAHQPPGPGLDVWVVRAWNERVEWIVLSTLEVATLAQANEKLDWYSDRWLLEDYHKGLKTGCRIEALNLSTVKRLEAALGLLAIVAVRLLQLRVRARQAPETPARDAVDPLWLKLVAGRLHLDPNQLSLHQFWHAVARLGGFIGRKSDGDPGWLTLWLGFQRLLDMAWAAGYALA